jgi:Protein of unknown function (DUF3606)
VPDETIMVGEPHRNPVPADQDYEVSHLALKHRLSQAQIRALISRVGNDRMKLDRAAKELSGRS